MLAYNSIAEPVIQKSQGRNSTQEPRANNCFRGCVETLFAVFFYIACFACFFALPNTISREVAPPTMISDLKHKIIFKKVCPVQSSRNIFLF